MPTRPDSRPAVGPTRSRMPVAAACALAAAVLGVLTTGCGHPAPASEAARSVSAGPSAPTPAAPGLLLRGAQPQEATPPRPARPLAGMVIAIDPGHNGGNAAHPAIVRRVVNAGNGVRKACNSTGTATRAGYPEHAFTFDVARRLAAVLRSRGATVVLTRPSDTGVGPCVNVRAAIANRAHADALISIHADGNPSSRAHGFHVIRSIGMAGGPAATARSLRLALAIRAVFRTQTGMTYSTYIGGGTALSPRRDIGTLNLARMPAVMIEAGNMRQARDAALLRSAAFRQRAARALADGLQAFLLGT